MEVTSVIYWTEVSVPSHHGGDRWMYIVLVLNHALTVCCIGKTQSVIRVNNYNEQKSEALKFIVLLETRI